MREAQIESVWLLVINSLFCLYVVGSISVRLILDFLFLFLGLFMILIASENFEKIKTDCPKLAISTVYSISACSNKGKRLK